MIALQARGYKVKGRQHIDLTWSGATTANVVVLRNGSPVAVQPNSTEVENTWTHVTTVTGGGTSTYRVCEANGTGGATGVCSPDVVVRF